MTLKFYFATLMASLVIGYFYGSMEFDMETRYAVLFSSVFGLCTFLGAYTAFVVVEIIVGMFT